MAIKLKWDLVYILDGLFKELLDLNIKLMLLILVPMLIWLVDYKQQLNSLV
jgi:ABC-type cobalamin transport system permease subunit